MGKIERIPVSPVDRARLEKLVRDRNTAQKVVWRSRIVLRAADGLSAVAVSREVGKSLLTVRRWRRRFLAKGVEGLLKDGTRPPGRKPLTAETIRRVVDLTLKEKPANATQWSLRTMAAKTGLAPSTVRKIWTAHGLKPHLVKRFKLSRDPEFAAKVEDIAGLYLNPPDKALVLSVDEKSQIQALDRTQPGLPMTRGRAGTMTHDYKRNGTTTLFAALNMLDGKVIGSCMKRHRAAEFLRFLKQIDAQTPPALDLHIIVDNSATHETAAVKRWIKQHPRFHFHFTPTSSSWINMVERFFAKITGDRIRCGVFKTCRRTGDRHHELSRTAQRRSKTVRLDGNRTRHPRQSRPCETSVGIGTLVTPIFVADATMYSLSGLMDGTLNNQFWISQTARKYAGLRGKAAGEAFEESAAERLRGMEMEAWVRCKLSSALNQKVGEELGDVDVLAVSRDQKRVWLIEAKNLRLCRTEAEVAARLSEYRGRMTRNSRGREEPDKMLRHIRRVQYLRKHRGALCHRLKLSEPPIVKGLLVVDAPQPMNFHMLEKLADADSAFLDAIGDFEF